MKTMLCAAVAALFPMAALAHDGIDSVDAYARGSNPQSGAIFMVLDNHRKVACTLSGVSSDAAAMVQLHTSREVDGIMKMLPLENGIEVPAEEKHALKRGGDHVMMMGLKQPLEDGQTIKLSLDFGDCGTQEIDVPVDNDRQDAPEAGADTGEGDHSGH